MSLSDYVARYGHHKYDHYFAVYEQTIGTWENEVFRLLEIGCSADSLTMWRKSFPEAEVIGLDTCSRGPTNTDDLAAVLDVVFIEGDQRDIELLKQLGAFDVVIDDAGHRPKDQILTFETLFPRMVPGGWYFIEDLHTSYWDEQYGPGNTVDWLKTLLDDLHARYAELAPMYHVAEFRMVDSLAAIRKA